MLYLTRSKGNIVCTYIRIHYIRNIILSSIIVTQQAYVHRMHLFVLLYISTALFKKLKFCKLHYISSEILHKLCKFYLIAIFIDGIYQV